MRIIDAGDFDAHWRNRNEAASVGGAVENEAVDRTVRDIIEAVQKDGDRAVRDYASRFDRSSPEKLEVPVEAAREAWETFRRDEGELAAALELAAVHIRRFAELQRKQFVPFENEMAAGLFAGQQVIPVERAAVYIPAGRFPLFSSVLMGMIPAQAAGVDELILASPPMENGLPDRRILAAAALAADLTAGGKTGSHARPRIFAVGGAQAIAALALGTETVPRVDVIAGPGNKYVAAAKRLLFGQVGIDFVAGPTDVLIIVAGGPADSAHTAAAIVAADMCAQAEHDPDARARALVPGPEAAEKLAAALEEQLAALPESSRLAAASSLEAGGLIIVYRSREEAIRIANI
ncbi:MAG: histidinol dehydrogenase, partial [Treponema sp.]|nr:histidinol dehydrogenase [Treponema sp.]